MESGGSSYAFNATCGGSATATRCVYILFKKTDDSSIENDDSFLENDDSSIENDDSSLETDDSCSNAWGLSLTLRLAACGITLVSRTGWGSVLPRCVLKIDFRLLSDCFGSIRTDRRATRSDYCWTWTRGVSMYS